MSIDVDRLRAAIYEVSVRHDWAHTLDTEDRTQEIVDEYELNADGSLPLPRPELQKYTGEVAGGIYRGEDDPNVIDEPVTKENQP